MKLKNYLQENNITQYKFAKRTGLRLSTISRIIKGQRFPRPHTMNLIEIASEGQVKANDFMKEAQERMLEKS